MSEIFCIFHFIFRWNPYTPIMKLKTSTSIALKFTGYVITILLLFGIGINIGSFSQRYRNEYNRIFTGDQWQGKVVMMGWGRFQWRPRNEILTVPYSLDTRQLLEHHKVFGSISEIEDDTYVMYRQHESEIKITDISHLVAIQRELALNTAITIVLLGILTFIFSRFFVRSSLHKINKLVTYVKEIDIHNLHSPVPLSGPEDDEIRIIGQALQNTLDTIKIQTDSLKDFVSYASHELKTPLATINTIIDVTEKTQKYDTFWPKIKKTLQEMSNLLDILLSITRREFQDMELKKIDIIPLIQSLQGELSSQHHNKAIIYQANIPDKYIISTNKEVIQIILSNLLNNAYKFTPSQWSILLSITDNTISISNTGTSIALEDQHKIRQRFRKKWNINETWYGLWLYMVKMLIEKMWRTITLQSTEQQWTTFTIYT